MIISKVDDICPVANILYRYPQLMFKSVSGLREKKEYIDIVRKGILPEEVSSQYIVGSENDSLTVFDTPAGMAEVLYLERRDDFKHFVRILGYKGEPKIIPDSMGAITIRGLINWRYNAIPTKDTLIIITKGGYSGISDYKLIEKFVSDIDCKKKWVDVSRIIRTYHELAHFVSRNMFIDNKEVIRDEIVADSIGIISAIGELDVKLLKLFLGIEKSEYREGGRLQNYVGEDENMQMVCNRANTIINEIYNGIKGKVNDPLELLIYIEKQRIGIGK